MVNQEFIEVVFVSYRETIPPPIFVTLGSNKLSEVIHPTSNSLVNYDFFTVLLYGWYKLLGNEW